MSLPLKRSRSPTLPPDDGAGPSSPHRVKKLKLLASHSISSPFPDFPHPTPAEATQVHALLSSAHPDLVARRAAPLEANNSARTCGSVPNVLESLIGTILSQNTSSRNSTAAKRGLDAAFGRNNFTAIADARKEALVDAIRTGGLANKKAAVIQNILKDVHARHGGYSLQHLAAAAADGVKLDASEPNVTARRDRSRSGTGATPAPQVVSDEEAMQELVSYDGVGPKTASCVLLFCLGRASFPVDTHVFRLSRLLGWVPQKADRVTAQAHLDLSIPNDLKFGLHVLMVGHGRRCRGCKAGSGGKGECVLKRWLWEQNGATEEDVEAKAMKAEEHTADADTSRSIEEEAR